MEFYEDKGFNVRLEVRLKNAELIKARETLGLNQREAAKLIGISPHSLGKFELLKYYPNKELQEKICLAYIIAGYPITEEVAFPETLRGVKLKGKFITEREIPPERLLPLSELSDRLLPIIQSEAVEKIYEGQRKEAIRKVLSELDERQRRIVIMYYGIDQDREYDMGEIAKELNVSKSRVSQLINKALNRLRNPKLRKKLSEVAEF